MTPQTRDRVRGHAARERRLAGVAATAAGLVLAAATAPAGAAAPRYPSPVSVAFGPAGRRAYVSGHGTDTVYVIDVPGRAVVRKVPVGKAPVGLAVDADGRRLYVANSRSHSVSVVDTATGKVVGTVRTGFEPLGLCLSPSGKRLYVANSISNEISVIDTAECRQSGRIAVARTPTFLAVTPDGKTLLASHLLSAMPATDPKTTAHVSVIDAAAMKVVGQRRSDQPMHVLQQIAVSADGRHAYTVHLQPNFNITPSQLGQGWIQKNCLTVVPLAGAGPPVTVLLDNVNRGAGNPYGVAISADGRSLYVTHTGVHRVSVIDLPRLHALIDGLKPRAREEAAYRLGLLWQGRKPIIRRTGCGGLGPKGIAVSPADGALLVANFFSGSVTVLDAGARRVVATIPLGPRQPETVERRGEFLFCSARHCFQNWLSCESCHPGVRADALNWDLMNDGLTNPKNAKSLVGSWQTPPSMALGVRARMEVAVEKGFLFIQFHDVSRKDKDAVSAYLRSVKFIPSPFHRRPDGSLDDRAKRGRKVFEKAGCDSCHPAPLYTDRQMYDVGTRGERDVRAVPNTNHDAPPKVQPTDEFDTPTLLEMYRTGPYLHDGRAATLREVLTKYNVDDRHGRTSNLTPQELDDLVAFLRSL